MTLFLFFIILFSHFIADFVMQSDEIALKKSTSLKALRTHGVDYLISTGLIFLLCMNAAWYLVVDSVSRKLITYFWKKEQRHWFFATISADPFTHLLVFFVVFI